MDYSVKGLFRHRGYLDEKGPAFKKFTVEQKTGMQGSRSSSHGQTGGDGRVGVY